MRGDPRDAAIHLRRDDRGVDALAIVFDHVRDKGRAVGDEQIERALHAIERGGRQDIEERRLDPQPATGVLLGDAERDEPLRDGVVIQPQRALELAEQLDQRRTFDDDHGTDAELARQRGKLATRQTWQADLAGIDRAACLVAGDDDLAHVAEPAIEHHQRPARPCEHAGRDEQVPSVTPVARIDLRELDLGRQHEWSLSVMRAA